MKGMEKFFDIFALARSEKKQLEKQYPLRMTKILNSTLTKKDQG